MCVCVTKSPTLSARLTEIYEHPAVALSLIVGHGHDAADIVLLGAVLLLAEVAHQVAALLIVAGQHVEEEGLHVVVQSLVVQEELDEQTEVLTVDLVRVAIHLKDGEVLLKIKFSLEHHQGLIYLKASPHVSVDFRSWWMPPGALSYVPV